MKKRGGTGGESLYNILGVKRDADTSQIKSAYNGILSDMGAGDTIYARKVQNAYQVLGNKNMRMRYNNTLDSQSGFETAEGAASDDGGERLITAYTIDPYGNWYTEKKERENLPEFNGNSAYILYLAEENVSVISKQLWNKWRDLCEIWHSKDIITDTIGNISLNVDVICLDNGKLSQSKISRKVSQLPLMFPNVVSEMGRVYAYSEGGDTVMIEEYDYMHLRRRMERQDHVYESMEW